MHASFVNIRCSCLKDRPHPPLVGYLCTAQPKVVTPKALWRQSFETLASLAVRWVLPKALWRQSLYFCTCIGFHTSITSSLLPAEPFMPVFPGQTRSGASYSPYGFAPYNINMVPPVYLHEGPPVVVTDNFDALMHTALNRETTAGQCNPDDSEGALLTDGPTTSHDQLDAGPPTLPPPPSTHPTTRSATASANARNIEARRFSDHKKKQRAEKRIAAAKTSTPYTRPIRSRPAAQARLFASPLAAGIDAAKLPRTKGGSWIGKRIIPTTKGTYTLEELLAQGFGLIEWDGW
ncbi:hypothetical protein FPV67DRAFT_1457043 [Lyophyllum atratum]|nr:hypothetical protein FPV67DRAFT_1457043 [Lyophyllum atratum]